MPPRLSTWTAIVSKCTGEVLIPRIERFQPHPVRSRTPRAGCSQLAEGRLAVSKSYVSGTGASSGSSCPEPGKTLRGFAGRRGRSPRSDYLRCDSARRSSPTVSPRDHLSASESFGEDTREMPQLRVVGSEAQRCGPAAGPAATRRTSTAADSYERARAPPSYVERRWARRRRVRGRGSPAVCCEQIASWKETLVEPLDGEVDDAAQGL